MLTSANSIQPIVPATASTDPAVTDELKKAAAQLDTALEQLTAATKKEAKPFDFDDSLTFSYRDGIFALGTAINNLLAIQPQIIASEMAISSEEISAQIDKWSQQYLSILQGYQQQIGALDPSKDPNWQTDLATLQGDMSVANAGSSASSTSLNGVLSMLTSGTSSKTSTYQSLIQQVSSVVTALLNAMTQNWS